MIKLCIMYLIIIHLNAFNTTQCYTLFCLRQGLDKQPGGSIVIEKRLAQSIMQERHGTWYLCVVGGGSLWPWTLQSSCLRLPRAGITGTCHYPHWYHRLQFSVFMPTSSQCGQPAVPAVVGTWLSSQTEWVQISAPWILWAVGQVPWCLYASVSSLI